MRIELTTDRAEATFEQRAGDVIDVPAPEATRLIKSGQAVVAPAPIETATAATPRNNAAVRPTKR